ncbi:hypothetical protein [Salarchaeum sp. JOR-1]|uniref:hypothetical protein n=1 Tax=Salarchaeum sp. JOR-1 TaxID=2599399 RepID=UPI001198AC6A|nr:hypothetical protein [Salarchaeum sp. JOR-1]QDX39747.1 hypothetical protein FQU85_02110 [Salarchaeum sp. JOR-1]
MNIADLSKPLALYAGVLAALTVGAVYVATDSGVLVLFTAIGGVTAVILSVGSTGPADGGSFENAEGLDAQGGWTGTGIDTPVSIPLLFYGGGVFLWSSLLLVTVYDILG